MILHSEKPVTLLGAGAAHPEDLALALERAPVLVAADGGAALALEQGRMPEAVIGDLDSVPPETLARIPPERVHRIAEQETTDFDKCLRSIAASLVIGIGFLGGRVDHQLAAMATLVQRPAPPCLLVGAGDVVFAAPPRCALDLPEGTRLSLFPLLPVTGSADGLRWPIEGLAFRPDGRLGTSNLTTGPVALRLDGRGMLVILPRAALDAAVAALSR